MAEMKTLTINNVKYDVVDANAIPAPSIATVGQTIVVKTVDENGKPTEWEAVDLPEGSLSGGITDVLELPTENISESSFYRLMTAKFVANQGTLPDTWTCYVVETLPETGDICTDLNMSFIVAYYNIADNDAYMYVNSELGTGLGISAGWYPVSALVSYSGTTWGGIITDITDDPNDGALRVLLSYDFYIYKNEWMKVPFAYEKFPEFDIQWNGVVGDKFALDISSFGYENTYYVKISDDVFTAEHFIGATHTQSSGYTQIITEDLIDTTTFPGALVVDNGVAVVYSADDFNAAIGTPAGYVTNGIYFVYVVDTAYTNRLVAPTKITKIDGKYLDASNISGLHSVAKTGSYYELSHKPTIYTDVIRYSATQSLSSTYKARARTNIDVYSKSEVDTKIANSSTSVDLSAYAKTTDVETMIAEAVSGAIGGSY